jgi:hypothetical protein
MPHPLRGLTRSSVAVGPQVGVGVQRLGGRSVPELRLHNLDGLAAPDQQAGVVVAQLVEARAGNDAYQKLISAPGMTATVVVDRETSRFLNVRFRNVSRPWARGGPLMLC